MPNICCTQVVIYSENKSVIHKLHAKLNAYIKTPANEDLSNNRNWLGNLLCNAGYDYSEVKDGKHGYCRGWVQYINEVEDNVATGYSSFSVDIEDAWAPNIEPWRKLITKLFPYHRVRLAWIGEEEGCEIYQKYDPDSLFFSDCEYFVDCYVGSAKAYKEYPELMDEHRGFTLQELQSIFQLDDIDAITARAEAIEEELQEKYGEGSYSIYPYEEMDNEY